MSSVNAVSLQLPSGWVEIDPREPDLVAEIERSLQIPEGSRDTMLTLLTPLTVELGRLTAAANIVLVGIYAQAIPIEGEELPFVVTGHVLLAISPEVGGLDEVRANLGAETTTPVELPVGPAVLVSGETVISDPAWPESVPARMRRYFVPVPGTDRVAALSFLTPNLDLADQFDEVFEGIAQTLEFELSEPAVT